MSGECVDILSRVLEPHAGADRSTAGFAVWALIDLAAVEAIDTIRAAFQRKSVDISIAGDEEDVEIALGLKSERSTPAPTYQNGLARRPVGPARDLQREFPAAQRPAKVGRNDPCPCGSGKKYKKCCLK